MGFSIMGRRLNGERDILHSGIQHWATAYFAMSPPGHLTA